VGLFDEDYFMFSEDTDWCYRFRQAGWSVLFTPVARCVHVGGASHAGRLYRENLRGHLRFMAKHRGARAAERTRWMLLVALRLRGVLFPGERGRLYRDGARFLASGHAPALLEAPR
jgi:GT2 family glycosyltransferase